MSTKKSGKAKKIPEEGYSVPEKKEPLVDIASYIQMLGGIPKRTQYVLEKMYGTQGAKTLEQWSTFLLDRNHDNIHKNIEDFNKKIKN